MTAAAVTELEKALLEEPDIAESDLIERVAAAHDLRRMTLVVSFASKNGPTTKYRTKMKRERGERSTPSNYKPVLPRLYEPSENTVHYPASGIQDAITLCGLTDTIGEEDCTSTRREADCKCCIAMVNWIHRHQAPNHTKGDELV